MHTTLDRSSLRDRLSVNEDRSSLRDRLSVNEDLKHVRHLKKCACVNLAKTSARLKNSYLSNPR